MSAEGLPHFRKTAPFALSMKEIKMICPKCYKQTLDGIANCTHCGYSFSIDDLNVDSDNKTIAMWEYNEIQKTDKLKKDSSNKALAIVLSVIAVVIVAIILVVVVLANSSKENSLYNSENDFDYSNVEQTSEASFENSSIGKKLLTDDWLDLTECFNEYAEMFTYFTFYDDGSIDIEMVVDDSDEYSSGKVISYTDSSVKIEIDDYGIMDISFADNSNLLKYKNNHCEGVLIDTSTVFSKNEQDSNNVPKQLKDTYWISDYISADYPESIIHFMDSDNDFKINGNLITENENILVYGDTFTSTVFYVWIDGYSIILELTDDKNIMNAFVERYGNSSNNYQVEYVQEQWLRQ